MAAMGSKSEEAMPQMLEQWTEGKGEGEELTTNCKTDGPAPVTWPAGFSWLRIIQ